MSSVNIVGLDKGLLLLNLVKATSPQGLGWLNANAEPELIEARNLAGSRYIDYYMGRPIKTDLRGDRVSTGLYNRDAGPGAFERIVARMRR